MILLSLNMDAAKNKDIMPQKHMTSRLPTSFAFERLDIAMASVNNASKRFLLHINLDVPYSVAGLLPSKT
jgi:hypothetical protein